MDDMSDRVHHILVENFDQVGFPWHHRAFWCPFSIFAVYFQLPILFCSRPNRRLEAREDAALAWLFHQSRLPGSLDGLWIHYHPLHRDGRSGGQSRLAQTWGISGDRNS